MGYDAVLFDFDGVIVETPTAHSLRAALIRACDRFGDSRSLRETMAGFMSGDFDSIAARCRNTGIETDDFCAAAARELIQTQRAEFEAGIRSAYDDITAIRALEHPLGIVSDNHPAVLDSLLRRFNLHSLFETVKGCPLTEDGFERRKPSPDNITQAMDTLDATNALYVGDREVDITAAANAGIDAALLARDGTEIATTVGDRATYQLDSLRQLPAVVS